MVMYHIVRLETRASRPVDLFFSDEDGDVGLVAILHFATGANSPPPRGWDTMPKLEFLHDPEFNQKKSLFPKANTCRLVLQLPTVHDTFEKFKEYMTSGILNAKGFGYA